MNSVKSLLLVQNDTNGILFGAGGTCFQTDPSAHFRFSQVIGPVLCDRLVSV